MKRKGFTLIELVVVIVIIAILATIVIVSYGNSQAKSRDAKRKTDVQAISSAFEMYKADKGTYRVSHAYSYQSRWAVLADKLKGYIAPLPTDPINNMIEDNDLRPWQYRDDEYAYAVLDFPTCDCKRGDEVVSGYPKVSGYCITANLETESGNGDDFLAGTTCGIYSSVGGARKNKLYVNERHYKISDTCPAGSASLSCEN